MAVYRVELRSSRRQLHHDDRVIHNIKSDGEVMAVFASLAGAAGVSMSGHTMRVIDKSGRRWKIVREVTG